MEPKYEKINTKNIYCNYSIVEKMNKLILGFLIALSVILLSLSSNSILSYAEEGKTNEIVIKDLDLIVEEYVSGLDKPVLIDFIDGQMLVIEKVGTVRIISDGILNPEPILELNELSTSTEEGLIGMLVDNNDVFLHYTTRDANDDSTSNWFTKYSWNGEKLIDPIELLSFHKGTGIHNAGVMIKDENGIVFATIGDLGHGRSKDMQQKENFISEENNYIGSITSLNAPNEVYAIGIRNTFGLDIDPVTGMLWDTENGVDTFDEINLIEKNFNSGWNKIQGPINDNEISMIDGYQYSDPEFSWERAVGVTSIHFIQSPLFPEYENSVLVGSFLGGLLYKFELNENRDGFRFDSDQLKDLVLDNEDNPSEIIFGTGFAGITDIKEGPDGSIYIVTIGDGKIFRISPILTPTDWEEHIQDVVESDCRDFSNSKIFSGCIFSDEDFIGKNFSNKDFRFTDFRNSNLTDVDFQYANLVNSNFYNAKLSNVNFSDANLDSVVFQNAKLENVNFDEASLISSDFQKTNLINVSFINSNLVKSSFEKVRSNNLQLMHANLERANLESSNLEFVNLENTNLFFTKFDNSVLKNSKFNDAKLWKTKLNNVDLENSSFIDTDNYYSQFKKSNLKNVDFQSSRLSHVDFTNSNLANANLLDVYPVNTIFDNTNLDGAEINTCLQHDIISRIINKILRSTAELNLEVFEKLLIGICN